MLLRVTLKCRRPLVCPVVVLTAELVFRGAGFSGGCLWCVFTVHPCTGRCDFGACNLRDTVFCKDWVNLRVGWPWPKVSLLVCCKEPPSWLVWAPHSLVVWAFSFCGWDVLLLCACDGVCRGRKAGIPHQFRPLKIHPIFICEWV